VALEAALRPSWVAVLGWRETTPMWECSSARLSAMVFPSRPMCPRIQATAVLCVRARRLSRRSVSMPDLGGAPPESCKAVCIAVVESDRTQTLRSEGVCLMARAISSLSPSATEARSPRKPPCLTPLSLTSWMKAPEATFEFLPEPSEYAKVHPSLVSCAREAAQ